MKTCVSFIYLFLLTIAICFAENNTAKPDDEIIVTATKVETKSSEVGTVFTVIGEEQMQKMGRRTVLNVLKSTQGIGLAQSGSFGGVASVYIRGTDSAHVLVMIDGVEVNDPMHVDRSYDFSHLTTDNVERIEIIRGPQSTIYGSDSIGGVVNIITKKGTEIPEINLFVEYGSDNTYKESVSFRGKKDELRYSVSISRLDTAGTSKAGNDNERDPYKNTTLSLNLNYDISDMTMLDFTMRYIIAEFEIDADGNATDPDAYSRWEDFASKFSLKHEINDYWEQIFSYSFSEIYRKSQDVNHPIWGAFAKTAFKGFHRKIEWQNNFYTEYFDTTTFGLEYEKESGSSLTFDKKQIINKSCYFQNQFKFFDSIFITPGIRIDDHERYDTEITYKISGLYNIKATDTTIKSNYGTGIKSPSLYQLFSGSGSENIESEKSKGYDFGFEQRFFNKKALFSLIYFYNEINDMITWVGPWPGTYNNINKAETKGYEIGFTYDIVKNFTIGMNLYYLKTKDKQTGLELARRPKKKANVNINWKFKEKHNINVDVNFIGGRKDLEYTTGPERRVNLDEYCTVDLSYLYDITDDFQIAFRIENLFDEDYEEVYGYDTKGTSYYVSARKKL